MPLVVEGDLRGELLDKFGPLGARSDDGHLPQEDVPQLRQFVDSASPQDPADARHARIIDGSPGVAILFRCRPLSGIYGA